MIAVNKLVQEVYEALNLVGLGEAADDTQAVTGSNELNRLITDLNSEDYLSMTQHWVDATPSNTIVFKKLREGETAESNVVDMEPPEKVEGVARKIGLRYMPLMSCDLMQMAQRSPVQLPTSWYYGREYETVSTELGEEQREVGIIRLDGYSRSPLRVWFNSQMPKYTLNDTIYLADSYNNLLFTGLKLRLARYFELSETKKQDCYSEHLAAKRLIKRNTITQRMMQTGPVIGSYNDNYENGIAGTGW